MRRILIQYNNKEVPAFLLARFHMVENELVSVKGLFGRRKDIFTPLERQYCLVFIPWKHQVKELVLVSMRDIITMDRLDGNDVVSIEKYRSPFTEEAPYYVEYKITDFVGYKFVYDYKNFIADVRNQCFAKPLELLYQRYPELLQEEFDEEQL